MPTATWLRYLKAADQPLGAPGHPGPLRGRQHTVGSRCPSSKGLVGKEGHSAAGRPARQAPGREGEPPRVEHETRWPWWGRLTSGRASGVLEAIAPCLAGSGLTRAIRQEGR